jgi:hypothetical protein
MAVENQKEAKRIFGGCSLWKNENKSFKSEVGTKFNSFWVTGGQCSCALYSYPYDPEAESEKFRKKFSRLKYRKKGWSQDRVEREVEQILNRKSKEKGGLSEFLFHCLQNYTKEVGRNYFHFGWYSGDQNKQGLKIVERTEVILSSGLVNASEIYEDVLYTFT